MKIENIISLMDQIINDRTVPRNIRRAVEESKKALSSNDPPEVRLSAAITTLDEIINDPNMPIYARTKIWNIVSLLEEERRNLG
ncbi:MAG: UPF0147 family protein [Candidatus Aenigmatarchaeota archaeon]